jgi:hypothetical protein
MNKVSDMLRRLQDLAPQIESWFVPGLIAGVVMVRAGC